MAEPIPIQVGFHIGNIIRYLAQMYGTGFEVLREAVQNSIDEMAKNIYIVIDCQRRTIKVFDDGDGAAEAEIKRKFENIGLSLKLGKSGKAGQKGIGNLAGLAVAERWQLITRDVRFKDPLRVYTFERSELNKHQEVKLHSEVVDFAGVNGAPFKATTLLRLSDVDEGVLKQLGDRNIIERTIREAFNAKLKSQKVRLRISYRDFKNRPHDFEVKPTRFRGTPLQPESYMTKYGTVKFEFYHSPQPVDNPTILVQHQGVYSIPLSNFFKLKMLSADIEPLFSKGYFEAEISLDFCTLNPSRSAFEHNDQLKVFMETVERFARDVIGPLVEQFEQTDREERLKRIAEGALKKMQQFLSKHPNLLPPGFRSIGGKKGEKVESPESKEPKKREREPIPPDALRKQREKSERGEKKAPKKRHLEVSAGLSIQLHSPDAEEGFNWHSRIAPPGMIQLNVANSDFYEAERRGSSILQRYMLLLVQKELTCQSLPPHDAEVFDKSFEKTYLSYWKASIE